MEAIVAYCKSGANFGFHGNQMPEAGEQRNTFICLLI